MENSEKNHVDIFAENQTVNQKEEKFDPLAVGGMTEIREMPSYEKMRDEAVAQYKENHKSNFIFLCIGIVGFLVALCIFLSLRHSPMIMIAGLFVLLFLAWNISCVKKFSAIKQTYRYRLHRAVEIMANAGVFMQVPKEDLERFDGFWK